MDYLALRNQMTQVLNRYHGYDPYQSKTKNALAFLRGHGREGYDRFLAFRAITSNSPNGDFNALRHALAQAYIRFYNEDQQSSRGSVLLGQIGQALKEAYGITNREIDALSPLKAIGSDGATYPDIKIGLLRAIQNKVQPQNLAGFLNHPAI